MLERMEDPKRLRSLDERLGELVRAAFESGELQSAKSWGKPLGLDGYFETPPALRMAFKVLKDAGCTPPEVELLRQLADSRARLDALDPLDPECAALRERINQLEVEVCLRLERLSRASP
jgi:hypothetical protein